VGDALYMKSPKAGSDPAAKPHVHQALE